ncbi:putative baseplate assembly protein [Oscillatoria sp. FACHB-1406]|uniref:putative baseplate assembly protein n=1 Tax=Oscillatoria sp. FACHB-1406 TaxID=2692846 RepID=UPI001687ED23|nr:putative baseplate assembly protein [Oscillatoria sp. FACHB-1406]MBD2576478.1 putative baseplate assembly protein [Oscillatoria sp. FACHB-1406]
MREYNFLPKLDKPNLDDRTFEDLLEECLLRIPRYCPEWTNHNPGDPGITLIELFAWLTDQMLLRFNQVPLRNYIVFLELLGIRLSPPNAAQTELTFYLTAAQPNPVRIPIRTEVATTRTETDEAIIFTTDRELFVGNPQIKHFLTSQIQPEDRLEDAPQKDRPYTLRNPFVNLQHEQNRQWDDIGEVELFEQSALYDCFYLVLEDRDERESLAGNVLAVTFKGQPATGTGINPDNPPLQWEAWNGREWQSDILRHKEDDRTKGFNFDSKDGWQGANSLTDGADAILHLPQNWPKTNLDTQYTGHWLRCVYRRVSGERQSCYISSPRITGLSVRAIGGSVDATECIEIVRELLGISNGKPGQTFELKSQPVLMREVDEHIAVQLLSQELEQEEAWQEVANFANSGPDDPHYTIDSLSGTVQFGPLVREPGQLKQLTRERRMTQGGGNLVRRSTGKPVHLVDPAPLTELDLNNIPVSSWQYGKVPPPEAEIYMTKYRSGGGERGNVRAGTLTVLKSAIPYVKSVINPKGAERGEEAESLEQAIIRIPELLRTRECAVTPEDFQRVVKQFKGVARARCVSDSEQTTPGMVRLLVVPDADRSYLDSRGIHPKDFNLKKIEPELKLYISDRKPLGIQVVFDTPTYVGVKVEIEAIVDRTVRYASLLERENFQKEILTQLYRFLNPTVGGFKEKGWEWGRTLYEADIITWCQQKVPEVRIRSAKLFRIIDHLQGWLCMNLPESEIALSKYELICSWAEPHNEDKYGHRVDFVD